MSSPNPSRRPAERLLRPAARLLRLAALALCLSPLSTSSLAQTPAAFSATRGDRASGWLSQTRSEEETLRGSFDSDIHRFKELKGGG